MKLISASDSAILIETSRVRAWFHLLKNSPELGLISVQPAYASVLVKYDPLKVDRELLNEKIQSLSKRVTEQNSDPPGRDVRIPVCYEAQYAPDIETVARTSGFSPSEIMKRHSEARYSVLFLGFMPGFAYLGGLPSELATPRLSTPRLRVPKGSVGIAGKQTGVYPIETPGGWQIIGRTPVALFDTARENPALLEIGDRVSFEAISPSEFEKQSQS